MRTSVSPHDSGGGAAMAGPVGRLRTRGAQRRVTPPRDDLAVAAMRVDRKSATCPR